MIQTITAKRRIRRLRQSPWSARVLMKLLKGEGDAMG